MSPRRPEDRVDLMLGQTISHYRIVETLGEGGMGVVYKAQDLKLDRQVALKFLPTHLSSDEEVKKRFIREARAASALDHPNVCPIHEIDETEDGRMFIAMAYCEGESIRQMLSRGPLEPAAAMDYARQVAEGLARAHEKGIVHRDVKPANIIVSGDGVARIVDFGLAKLAGESRVTRTGSTLGTAAYLSPEQARGSDVDQRSDIWSLGVVLYEMATGQLPFKGDHEHAVVHSILNDDPSSASDIRPAISAELDDVIHRALLKDSLERYQDAGELAADLRRIKEWESGEAAAPPVIRSPRKGYRKPWGEQPRIRSPWVMVPLAIILLSVIALTSYFGFGRRGEPAGSGGNGGRASSAAAGAVAAVAGDSVQWENSIAILPFNDASPDRDQEHFCRGMVEAISEKLGRVSNLKVVSPRVTMKFRDGSTSIREIGRELGVNTVLEGSVLTDTANIRLVVRLVNTADESTIWSDTYTLEATDSFQVQDETSVTIAREMKFALDPKPHQAFEAGLPANPEAYEYYLRARHYISTYYNSEDERDYNAAISMLDKAMELEPDYVLGYCGYAMACSTYCANTGDQTDEMWSQLTLHAEKAYELNPDIAHSNALMGYIRWNGMDIDGAYGYLKKAVDADPLLFESNHFSGILLWTLGLNLQAIPHFKKALKQEPFSYKVQLFLADNYARIGDEEGYWEQLRIAEEIEPVSGDLFMRQAIGYVERGDYEKVEEIIALARENGLEGWTIGAQALMYAKQGRREEALALNQSSFVYALLGMNDEAIEAIEQMEQYRGGFGYAYSLFASWMSLTNSPFYANLRDDPRFLEIVVRQHEIYDERLKKYGDL